jgi:hypothetical protein
VLSTLHTNSAAETVTRLLDMGMDPFNFADSLLAVLAQRLVRRLCSALPHAAPMPAWTRSTNCWHDYLHAFAGRAAPGRRSRAGGLAPALPTKASCSTYQQPGLPEVRPARASRAAPAARADGGEPRGAPSDPDRRARREGHAILQQARRPRACAPCARTAS